MPNPVWVHQAVTRSDIKKGHLPRPHQRESHRRIAFSVSTLSRPDSNVCSVDQVLPSGNVEAVDSALEDG